MDLAKPKSQNGSDILVEDGSEAALPAREISMSAEDELKQLRAQLKRADDDFTQFVRVVSHDFTEPLQIVLGYADLLATRYRDQLDGDADRYVVGIQSGAQRIRALIDDLLVYSRLDRKPLRVEKVDSGEIIDDALDVLSERIEREAATIRMDAHTTVVGDANELSRLFRNLIDNAIKFRSADPPEIRILATREQDGWCFCVRDNGIGIDRAEHRRVFEMFQRLHTQAEYPGTGAGLAIGKKIVDRHGGRIWVDSAPGLGSTFYFTIPFGREQL
jgi:light-regulated signal transduction histidine kinase (bacteriophytochrome)